MISKQIDKLLITNKTLKWLIEQVKRKQAHERIEEYFKGKPWNEKLEGIIKILTA